MARPKKDSDAIKSVQMSLRMTKKDYLLVSQYANTYGLKIQDYIRRRALKIPLPRTKVTPIDRTLFIELSRIGNNLNQLAKKSHLGMYFPENLQFQINKLRIAINELKSKIIRHDS